MSQLDKETVGVLLVVFVVVVVVAGRGVVTVGAASIGVVLWSSACDILRAAALANATIFAALDTSFEAFDGLSKEVAVVVVVVEVTVVGLTGDSHSGVGVSMDTATESPGVDASAEYQ